MKWWPFATEAKVWVWTSFSMPVNGRSWEAGVGVAGIFLFFGSFFSPFFSGRGGKLGVLGYGWCEGILRLGR